ncbi:hypothetical protein SAMN05428987_5273 [Paenibacillus sp. CF095]|uniref:hypothetical protein n=1 Tax=Paenibacillus sp. CF095 TaxID=1881033 RepID=UPI00087E8FFC|nr:hypothetical protein [Paenibacillus sp. CF095]SDD55442.1 hypothetical protein SAMN05428987_5273 [Paenibacillus sp. CF095]
MLKIKPIRDPRLWDCFESLIVSICVWKERNFHLMDIGSWSFSFQHPDVRGIENIIDSNDAILSNLYNYHGIKLYSPPNLKDPEIALLIIKEQLSRGLPVILYLNTFWCPWDRNYLKSNSIHACLITGISTSGNEIECMDAWYDLPQTTLTIEEYLKAYFSIEIIHFQDEKKYPQIHDFLYSTVENVLKTGGVIDNIRMFADSLGEVNLKDYLTSYRSNPWGCHLIKELNKIQRYRLRFSKLLSFLYEIDNQTIDNEVICSFNTISFQWETLKNSLIKSIFARQGDQMLDQVALQIHSIADSEYTLAEALLGKNFNDTAEEISNIDFTKETEQIDLTSYFNNIGFYNEKFSDCDLTGTGSCYMELEQLKNKFETDLEHTYTPNHKFDNISCSGQTIHVTKRRYRSLSIVECSEWGNSIDKIVVNLEDGDEEILNIVCSDWGNKYIGSKESIYWSGKGIDKESLEISDVYIYEQEIIMQLEKEIVSITLPNNPSIHIFSISLKY